MLLIVYNTNSLQNGQGHVDTSDKMNKIVEGIRQALEAWTERV